MSLPLPIGSYRLPAPAASARKLVNCYIQQSQPDSAKQPVTLLRAPGILDFNGGGTDTDAMRAQSEQRGAVIMGGVLYVVAGSVVYSVNSSGVATALTGDAISGNGPVRMAANNTTFVVLPGNGDGFSSDGSTVAQITDATFNDGDGAADPCFVDGYLAFRRLNDSFLFHTAADAVTFDGTFFTDVDGAPGHLIGMIANNRQLIAVKEATSEVYYDAANSVGSVFSRSPNGFYEQGCAAGQSLTQQDNAPFMLANDRTFRRLDSQWQRVSHHGIEAELQRMAQVSDGYALPYRQEGHHFIAWTFPNAGVTQVLDLNTQEWHHRESRVDTVSLGRWRPAFCIEAYGKQIVGDSVSGKLGILNPDTHMEWDDPQTMAWTYGNVYASGKNAVHRRLEIGIAAGYGTITGQGADPKMTLFVSRDGGNTFTAQPLKQLGKIGEYRRRVQYFGLGMARDMVYRCEVSDPIRTMIVDTQLDAIGAST